MVMKRLNLFYGAAALVAVALAASPTVMAQENGNRDEYGRIVRGPYETNRFGDNWFIGVGGGINSFWNDGMKVDDMKIGPSIDANFGKWFTPAVGMRAGYQGINFQTNNQPKLGYMYFHGDFLWNISDAIGGYKETRFWDFVPYLHAGYYRSYGLNEVDFADNEIATGAGLLHNLRLTERLDLIIDMRATVVNGRAHGATGPAVIPSVTAGFAVDLRYPAFVRASTVVEAVELMNVERVDALETTIAALELANAALLEKNKNVSAANEQLQAENAALKDKVAQEPDYTEFFEGLEPATLYFEIGQAVLNAKELAHLDFIAKSLITRADSLTKLNVTILGSADSNTGSKKRNQDLSQARAKYVSGLLTEKYGLSPDRFEVKSEVVKGGQRPEMSRAVILSF